MTIDGQATLDFDDALSIERIGDQFRLGIHIVDVGHFVRRGDIIDQEALSRGSSIYMPDQKISMLPASLAEGLCSLKGNQPVDVFQGGFLRLGQILEDRAGRANRLAVPLVRGEPEALQTGRAEVRRQRSPGRHFGIGPVGTPREQRRF